MDVIYGKSGFSFFDVWALVHFCFWVFFGSCVWAIDKKTKWGYTRILSFFACLGLAFGWEGLESFLAPRMHERWGDWFIYEGSTFKSECTIWMENCRFESWWNSWISDPLTCVVGVVLVWILLDNRKKR
jgi:hypothetical protein